MADFFLLHAPLVGHLVKEGCLDLTVDFIDVDRFQTLLQAVILCSKLGNSRFVFSALVFVPLAKGFRQPVEDFLIEREAIQHPLEALDEDLFPDIGLVAFAFVAGAAIVDVAALLDVADQRAATMSALHKAGKSKIVLLAALRLGRVSSIENALHAIPKLFRRQCGMLAFVDAAVPVEIAGI